MLAIFIIIFREVLEISLIIGIVMAATREIPGRNLLVLCGIAAGIIISSFIALCMEKISASLNGYGQELFNAAILFLAILMIGWTVIWMKQYAKKLSKQANRVKESIASGEVPAYQIAIIIASTIIREGVEIILFTHGMTTTTNTSAIETVTGLISGLACGAIVGVTMYFGLLKISGKYIFKISNILLTLLASAMAAQVANYLLASEVVTILAAPVWDSSAFISDASITGQILRMLIGYNAAPSELQLLFYCGTLTIILSMLYCTSSKKLIH
jgi:high-affinity iron transporter